MNQFGLSALFHVFDALSGMRRKNHEGDTPREPFAWGDPQRFSIGRIVAAQRYGLPKQVEVETLRPSPTRRWPSRSGNAVEVGLGNC